MKAPNPVWRGEFLISSHRHGYCDVLWEFFLKVFNSGQSEVRSGTSMTTCCVVNANILNTLIQLDNSKHRSRAISRLSEGRKVHVLSCIIDYPESLSPVSLRKYNLFLFFSKLNFSYKVFKSFVICRTLSKLAVIYAPSLRRLCSDRFFFFVCYQGRAFPLNKTFAKDDC